jgi:hypothetical protein
MAWLMQRVRRSRFGAQLGDARGAEIAELAIILPLLLIVTAGIVDFGLLFRDYEIVTNAAREGARLRVLPGYTNQDAIDRAVAYLTASGLTSNIAPTVTTATITPGGGGPAFPVYTVTVQYDHTITMLGPMLRLIGGNFAGVLRVTGTAVMRSETVATGS